MRTNLLQMPIVLNLSNTGFFQLKEDREKLKERIKILTSEVEELEKILSEYDDLYERIQSLYEPEISIRKEPSNPNVFTGTIKISYPKNGRYKFSIGKISEFSGINDPKLKILAQKKANEKLKSEFPTFFND